MSSEKFDYKNGKTLRPESQHERGTGAAKVEWDNFVERGGLFYKKFTNVPFTGEVTGQEQGQIKDGKPDGPWVKYYENGQLRSEGDWEDGEPDGPWVNYYENGQVLHKGYYRNGKRDGPWVGYHNSGQLWGEGDYKDGEKDGPWVWYHDSGQLSSKGDYKDGKRDGPWVWINLDDTKKGPYSENYCNGEKVGEEEQ